GFRSGSRSGWRRTGASRSRTSFRAWPREVFSPSMTEPPQRPAFLFSGQLSETPGMGRDFFEADPEARALFAATSQRCGIDLEKILFSGSNEALHENLAAQAG